MIDYQAEPPAWQVPLMLLAFQGIPLFLGIHQLHLRYPDASNQNRLLWLGAVGLLAFQFWLFADPPNVRDFFRYGLLQVSFHLLVAFAPYWAIREENGFWQYNQRLFLRILAAALYSAVLYLGISASILSISVLFDIKIEFTIYARLWVLMVGLFNTWFFLGGVPRDFAELEADESYPRPLKLFTQFVLLPLVSLYGLILFGYALKILFTWNLPKGLVSYLVLAFSGTGIFSLLLIHPLRKKEGHQWIQIFARFFFLALLPLLALLFVAIGRRILDYGVTEPRYIVLVLALWLFGLSLYFVLRPRAEIRYIPISLALLMLFSAYGPWSASSVSEYSQLRRLDGIYKKYQLWQDGRYVLKSPRKKTLPFAESEDIRSVISFLDGRGRLATLQSRLDFPIDSLLSRKQALAYEILLENLFLPFEVKEEAIASNSFYFQMEKQLSVLRVKDFDYLIEINAYFDNDQEIKYKLGDAEYQVVYEPQRNQLRLLALPGKNEILHFNLNLLLEPLLKSPSRTSRPEAELTLIEESAQYKARLLVKDINVELDAKGKGKVRNFQATLLLRF
ncbi:MAG: hypothetical protein OHK0053_04520 [Microscillaceae bacterium]